MRDLIEAAILLVKLRFAYLLAALMILGIKLGILKGK